MSPSGSQVLPDGQEVHVARTQVVHQLEHLVALLAEPAERALFEAFHAVDASVAAAEKEHRYSDALMDLASLRTPIDAFFDGVLVMAEDEAVRANRLRLLGRIVDRVQRLADLSRITPPEEREP